MPALSRFGPTQMARLLQLILLVDALWPICWRRDSSRSRRRRLAAGNLLATLREQERNADKADVAHSRPRSLPKAGGSQRLCCAAFQVLSASGQCSCASGRKHAVASHLLISPKPTQGKAPSPCPFPQNPTPAQQERAARKHRPFAGKSQASTSRCSKGRLLATLTLSAPPPLPACLASPWLASSPRRGR